MYAKPTLSVVDLAVEHNSCKCGPSTGVGGKLNPGGATCGGLVMTTQPVAPVSPDIFTTA